MSIVDFTLKSRPIKLACSIPIARIKEFWRGLSEGKLYATKCRKCGRVSFPTAADCSNCYESDFEWMALSDEGEVEAFTHVVVRAGDFLSYEPYTIAIVKLREGVKVMGWLTDVEFSEVKVGMKVKLKFWESHEGSIIYSFTPYREG